MDTLYTSGDNVTHYKTESVHFLGLMNSATKVRIEQRLGYVMGCGANIVKPEGMVFVLLVVFMVYPSILPFQANPRSRFMAYGHPRKGFGSSARIVPMEGETGAQFRGQPKPETLNPL